VSLSSEIEAETSVMRVKFLVHAGLHHLRMLVILCLCTRYGCCDCVRSNVLAVSWHRHDYAGSWKSL